MNAVRTELSWTHYRIICRLDAENLRNQYVIHAVEAGWDTRTLQRNITSQYIGRVLFASKYRLYLPKEDELKELIEQDRIRFELDNDLKE